MRPLSRQGLRLASRNERDACHRTRKPYISAWQLFSTSNPRSSLPRTPPSSSQPGSKERSQHEEPEKPAKHDTVTKEFEHGEPETSNGHPRLKRTFRQRRMGEVVREIPDPPATPRWFLDHNVVLRSHARSGRVRSDIHLKASLPELVVCKERGTGRTLFTAPYATREIPPEAIQELLYFYSQVLDREKSAEAKTSFTRHLERHHANGQEVDVTEPRSPTFPLYAEFSTMSWPFLEAQLSIEAALAIPSGSPKQSSFAASRVDISLLCPDNACHATMTDYVKHLGSAVGADVVCLDVNDLEDLAADYVGQGRDEPGSFSAIGYDALDGLVASGDKLSQPTFTSEKDNETEPDDGEDDLDPPGMPSLDLDGLRRSLGLGGHLRKQLEQIYTVAIPLEPDRGSFVGRRGVDTSSDADIDDRIAMLLDSTLDTIRDLSRDAVPHDKQKRGGFQISKEESRYMKVLATSPEDASPLLLPTQSEMERHAAQASWFMLQKVMAFGDFELATEKRSDRQTPDVSRTIIHVRDLKAILQTRTGERMIGGLLKVVQKRRNAGESVVIVGTTVHSGFASWASSASESRLESSFRDIKIPAEGGSLFWECDQRIPEARTFSPYRPTSTLRIFEINWRHIESMVRRFCPASDLDRHKNEVESLSVDSRRALSERVLSMDEVQRLVLVAYGLSHSMAQSAIIQPIHIGLATIFTTHSDRVAQVWSHRAAADGAELKAAAIGSNGTHNTSHASGRGAEAQKSSHNQHETRLLPGLVNASNIKVGFADVHATPDTIEALKTMTTLSLARPEAFKYGVLAADRLPGVLLYGPPGTGKTLLAKAVAKESGATVLEISGAQIYEKYVGEGEKMVRAVFSLAKKMSPCVVFMDEADALFGARQTGGGRNTHREIINQFLREWDGMDDHKVLMMVATNRPFDLDDAVLRRLPRRLLVDLPVEKDREAILGIHLKEEQLAEEVSLVKLAQQTPLYSGSDLKNLCVAAALACVREENDVAATKQAAGEEYKFPEKRTLHLRHFDTATSEISASINEDMSTLSAIRKFDEQYGDRRGRRKKNAYGFGTAEDTKVDETAARVRQGSVPPPDTPSSAPPAA